MPLTHWVDQGRVAVRIGRVEAILAAHGDAGDLDGEAGLLQSAVLVVGEGVGAAAGGQAAVGDGRLGGAPEGAQHLATTHVKQVRTEMIKFDLKSRSRPRMQSAAPVSKD